MAVAGPSGSPLLDRRRTDVMFTDAGWIVRVVPLLLALLLISAVADLAAHLLPGAADRSSLWHLATGALATGLCLLAAAGAATAERRPAWLVISVALVVATVDDRLNLPIQLFDVLIVAGVWLLARTGRPRWHGGNWSDAVTVGAAAAGLLLLGNDPVTAATGAALLAGCVLVGAGGGNPTALAFGATLLTLGDGSTWLRVAYVAGLVTIGVAAARAQPWPRPIERRFGARTLPINPTLVATAAGLLLLAVAAITPSVPVPLLPTTVPMPATLLATVAVVVALLRGAARHSGGQLLGIDQLTGLASRQALSEALAPGGELALPALRRADDQLALVLVDLDRFQEVNEALGHKAGDAVLTEVGERLRAVLRPEQLLARLGGDEFAVLLPGADSATALRIAGALRESLAAPIEVPAPDGDVTGSTGTGGTGTNSTGTNTTGTNSTNGSGTNGTGPATRPVVVQASVGFAGCALPWGNPADLLRQADAAVHQAKRNGTGIAEFDPSRDGAGPARLQRIVELREAVAQGELEVFLQPQVDLARGTICGAEALARWRHPQDGVLLPASFLPLAAQTGLTSPLVDLVITRAVSACAQWWHAGHHVGVSVNVSIDDVRRPELRDQVLRELAAAGLPGRALKLELTENVMLAEVGPVVAALRPLRQCGVQIALDDYGTGYATLAYLRDLPIDELKLDRSYVVDLAQPAARRNLTIVRHTVELAHGLGMIVVGEGVEDQRTARALADAGADIGQGLYFGDAMDVGAFVSRLAAA